MTTYARRLGLFSATMAVVGGIIGGGIFRTPAAVAERVGSPGLALGAWVVGGVVALIGAFCFGELGYRRPRAGGGYVYLREAWGPLPAFLYGWALLLVIATGAIAAVAVTFADYALALAGLPARAQRAAWRSARSSSWPGSTTSASTPGAITVEHADCPQARGARRGHRGRPRAGAPRSPVQPAAERGGAGATLAASRCGAALVPVLFTYGGWQQTNFIAEEIVEPERTLPRALVLGVLIVVAVYLLANLAYLRVLGPAGLARSTAPAADTMRASARAGGWNLHRRRHRHLDLRVPRPRHPGDAAGAPGDGGRRRLLPLAGSPASALPDAYAGRSAGVRLGDRPHAHGHVRPARGLCLVRRLDLLRPHRRGAVSSARPRRTLRHRGASAGRCGSPAIRGRRRCSWPRPAWSW